MKVQKRILVLDKSVLAGNLYRLLLSKLNVAILVRRKFEDLKPILSRGEKIDLAILNSNAFGKKFDEIVSSFESDGIFEKVKKVFLVREGEAEEIWLKRVEGVKGAKVITKPFHPDEFKATIEALVGEVG